MSRNAFCQRNYGGSCECSGCGRVFGGIDGFERHRITMTGVHGFDADFDWRCGDDAELAARGLRQDLRGRWVRQDGYSARRESTESRAVGGTGT